MNRKTGILRIIDVTELQLANIRSILSGFKSDYIEIANTFYILGINDDALVQPLEKIKKDKDLKYIFVFIDSTKSGCWVNSRGLTNNDKLELRRIINEKYKY